MYIVLLQAEDLILTAIGAKRFRSAAFFLFCLRRRNIMKKQSESDRLSTEDKKLDALYNLIHVNVESKPRERTCKGCFFDKICWKKRNECTTYYFLQSDGVTKEQFLQNITPDSLKD